MGQRSATEPHATFFAPAARATTERIEQSVQKLAENPILSQILEATGSLIVVLNEERQIVAANTTAIKASALCSDAQEPIVGLRPGEHLGCVHVADAPNGCGTGVACAQCGVSRAIMDALINHHTVEYEAILRTQSGGNDRALEYLIRAAPLLVASESLLLVTMTDISDKKRRENLERTFYHDLMNTISALYAYRSLADVESASNSTESIKEIGNLVGRIVDEVRAHRALMTAEQKLLSTRVERICSREVAEDLRLAFEKTELSRTHQFEIDCCEEWFQTDRTLLIRVLTNMLKNAFEAAEPTETVRFTCERDDHHLTFTVQNPGKIPEEVALRIFTRSFTTKGEPGRGLGTYSMKLLGERYLHGKVTFTSDDVHGTRFMLRIPLRIGNDSERAISSRMH